MIEKLKEEGNNLSSEIKEKTVGYIVTALGLIAGLAWNDFVKSLIETFVKQPSNSLYAKLFYAIVITIIIVVVTVYLARLSKRKTP